MNPFALAVIVTMLAGVIAGPAMAGNHAAKPKTIGQLIDECVRDVERGHTVGRKMTPQQRMTLEAQCRARAEAELTAKKS